MPRLTTDAWETIRAERETGASFPSLATKWGVSYQAIQKRAQKEGWGDGRDVAECVRRKIAEKVVGVVVGCNPKKKAEAIDSAADRGAGIIARHRQDWEDHRARFTVNAVADDFELGKSAKISAEMLMIRQKGERSAYGLEEASQNNVTVVQSPTVVDYTVPPEIQEMLDKFANRACKDKGNSSPCA